MFGVENLFRIGCSLGETYPEAGACPGGGGLLIKGLQYWPIICVAPLPSSSHRRGSPQTSLHLPLLLERGTTQPMIQVDEYDIHVD